MQIDRIICFIAICVVTSCATPMEDYKTDLAHQKVIVDAYYQFYWKKHRRPTTLEELVREGLLPEYANFYWDKVDFRWRTPPLHYSQSSYKIVKPQKDRPYKILAVKKIRNEREDWISIVDVEMYAQSKVELNDK